MSRTSIAFCGTLFFLAIAVPLVHAQDIREQFGTRDMVCARAIQNAIQLSNAKQQEAALQQIRIAVKADPQCSMAQYWFATILRDMGNVDESMKVGAELVAIGRSLPEGEVKITHVEMAIDMGLTYGKLNKHDESIYWFSQAILLDLKDRHSLQWKSYRNMAISSFDSGNGGEAFLQALKAKELAPTRVEDQMLKDFAKSSKRELDCINILRFNKEPIDIDHPVRTISMKLVRKMEIEEMLNLQTRVIAMVPVPGQNLVVCFLETEGEETTTLVYSTESGEVRRFPIQGRVVSAECSGNELFISLLGKSELEVYDLDGRSVKSYSLPKPAIGLDVCSRTQQVFMSIEDVIHILDLKTGKIVTTELIGQQVVVDEEHGLVYATYKPIQQSSSGHFLINGRPIYFNIPGDAFADQNIIIKAAYQRDGVAVIAAIRTEAAANGYTISLTRDGKWITVTGGGGYRRKGNKGGYGTGILSAEDMSKLEGFYPIEPYSSTTAFNPVTDQVALIATGELRVFHLGNTSHDFIDTGSYQPVATWSSDGAWLFVAGKEQGMSIYENELTSEDRSAYQARLKDHGMSAKSRKASKSPSKSTASKANLFKKLPTLTKFTPESVLAKSKAKATAAARSKSEVGPPKMKDLALYSGESEALQQVLNVLEKFDPKEAGLAVYQLKGVLKEHPDFVPATYAIGLAQCANNNYTEGIPFLLTAIRSDAGQSTITTESLCLLAEAYLKNGSESEALDCLGTVLMLDVNNEDAIRLITPLSAKHGIPLRKDADPGKTKVEGQAPATSEMSPTNVFMLRLPPHRKTGKALSTEELFAVVAQRTASIKTDSGFGSGVFITDEGHLLTNHHVVQEPSSSIDVTMFAMKNGQLEKSGVSPATIVFEDAGQDIAVLKVAKPAAGQKGLSISKDPPATGMKVFAIGSPGLGDRVLEQSLTEGIISSNQRTIEGVSWLQHSAAISPGNSGGPLVSQYGEIIGLVTLKSKLENVGFAIPATRIREALQLK